MMHETPWQAGRFDARRGAKKVLFGRMYEDIAIEQEAFAGAARILCIASAGCTAIALAKDHAVTAVDVNPVQLAYAEQRAAGGLARIGSAERVLALGRRIMALCGWRRSKIEAFLDLQHPEEQMAFWNRHLNRPGFRAVTDALVSARWLRLVYASPFIDSLPQQFGRVMRARLERCWSRHPNRTNPYARGLLLGEFPDPPRWPGAAAIRFVCADAAAFLESCASGSFDGFTLSNIFDGAPAAYRQRLFVALRRAGTPDSVVVTRSFADSHSLGPTNLAAHDRSMLWGVVDVRAVQALE